jgi:hypothetical protein
MKSSQPQIISRWLALSVWRRRDLLAGAVGRMQGRLYRLQQLIRGDGF